MIAAVLLTVGATIATFAILAGLHATDPAHHKPIGGLSHFDDGMYSLTQLATVAAVLIGATGAGDLASGFSATSSSDPFGPVRGAFPAGSRCLAGQLYGIPAAFSFVVPAPPARPRRRYHRGQPWFEPSPSVPAGAWPASLLGSRATTLAVLAGFQLLITPVVEGLHNPASALTPCSGSRSGSLRRRSS
jgi:hypothetical protein